MVNEEIKDIQGKALWDYFKNRNNKKPLILHNDYGEPEKMPKEVFFLEYNELNDLDLYALSMCRGKIVDVGAGAGRHVLPLQKTNEVSALEISPLCNKIMAERGVNSIIEEDIFNFKPKGRYDTILMLMNGIGLAGSLEGVKELLKKFKDILSDNGQVLFDSSDISYLYRDTFFPKDRYFGEVTYQYEYNKEKDEKFGWIYIDKKTISKIASQLGYHCQVIYSSNNDQYLARLKIV
jgi:SAM-dependent methyltransferase